MGDDTTIVVPPEPEEPELDAIGMELVNLLQGCQSRIDQLVITLGEQSARITGLEARLAELGSIQYAAAEHSHEGLADTGHGHAEYALAEHAHEEERETRQPDKPPENQHPYFRKVFER